MTETALSLVQIMNLLSIINYFYQNILRASNVIYQLNLQSPQHTVNPFNFASQNIHGCGMKCFHDLLISRILTNLT